MKVSGGDTDSGIPKKIVKLSREELKEADKDTLVEKILSLTDQLTSVAETAKSLKTRESLARLQYLQKDKELKDLIRERNDAYYSGVTSGPAQRDQLLDPFFYEAFLTMKEKIASRDNQIATLNETLTAFESERDCKVLKQFLATKTAAIKRLKDFEKNMNRLGFLENRLALAHAALRAVRKEKMDFTQEIAERDAKIAELEKELFHLRNEVTEEATSEQAEAEPEEPKADVDADAAADDDEDAELDVDEFEEKLAEDDEEVEEEEEQEEDDVFVVDDDAGIEVDVSVLHQSGAEIANKDEANGAEERSVSVGENGVLKITV
ncbi:hypothetical protein Q1695_008369 [Nippostrongylus brasiliensis]|nr:hypothetical protein Q1695_008369 [Nippostrongylus brasiliensis]